VAVVLFVASSASSGAMYSLFFADEGSPAAPGWTRAGQGALFSAALMAILLAHELGHWFVARIHGFSLSLPWFLPFPNAFGTLGAVIRLRSLPRSRQALLEMGVAGPLAGAAVAFALLWVSLRWAVPGPPLPPETTIWVFEDPLVVRLVGLLTTGEAPDRLAIYHPVTMAAWVGCFLTGLNLLPIGQLDGGHVLNATSPRLASVLSRVLPLLLIVAGFWWTGWLLWGVLLLLLSAGRPLPIASGPALPGRARVLAACALVLFILTFLPQPFVVETTPAAP
jgi:membrane-associated protease RseP (regulator of RpoE activity)